MKNIMGAIEEYAAIVEGFAKEYTDDTTVETVRAEHSELDFMEDNEIVEILEHAKNVRKIEILNERKANKMKERKRRLVLVMGGLEWVDILEAEEIRKRDVRYIGTDFVEDVDIYEDCDTGEFLGYEFMEI